MSKVVKLGLVDDHQIVLDGLLALLHNNQNVEVVFTETNPAAVLNAISGNSIDLLITDIMMPEMSGNVLAQKVKQQFPEVKIMALSMSDDGDMAREMIEQTDIVGYALKNISKEDLLLAIDKINNGGIYFSKEILEALAKADNRKKAVAEAQLTTREIEIIKLIEKEMNNKQIAETLFISERTVESHRKNICRKTQTSSALGIVKYAYEHKLI